MESHNMKRSAITLAIILLCTTVFAADKVSTYLWFEPEWFEGVEGGFGYWSGPASYKPTGHWGIAGPGISAEWSTGGESEWNSMGAPPNETKAECHRDFIVPRAGKYKIWVRYYDHRNKTEPFTVSIQQGGKSTVSGELGVQPVVPPNDEFQLYWGFSFGWGSINGDLNDGAARLAIEINKEGEEWRPVDAVLITDDLNYAPVARAKPPCAYTTATALEPGDGASWRGAFKESQVGANWKRAQLGGQEFTMWVNATSNGKDNWKWWAEQNIEALTLFDWFFALAHPSDISAAFTKQFAGQKNLPIMSWPHLLPGLYLGHSPDLSPEKPLFQWLVPRENPSFFLNNTRRGAFYANK